jgi:hypothetical protein
MTWLSRGLSECYMAIVGLVPLMRPSETACLLHSLTAQSKVVDAPISYLREYQAMSDMCLSIVYVPCIVIE